MMLLKKVLLAFSSPKPVSSVEYCADSARVRKIVKSRSHGNLRLQMGQYYMKKDVDALFARIRKINFVG